MRFRWAGDVFQDGRHKDEISRNVATFGMLKLTSVKTASIRERLISAGTDLFIRNWAWNQINAPSKMCQYFLNYNFETHYTE